MEQLGVVVVLGPIGPLDEGSSASRREGQRVGKSVGARHEPVSQVYSVPGNDDLGRRFATVAHIAQDVWRCFRGGSS